MSLDTNAVIAAINRRVPGVRPRVEAAIASGELVGISTIVLFELRRDRQERSAARKAGVLGNLIKIVWHDGIGMSLYAKR
jgi:predicted nucleic acid-binding protein